MEEIAQKAVEETGSGHIGYAALVFALFIIWKLVEEILRYRGMKVSKKNNGNPHSKACLFNEKEHEMLCKWRADDHNWLQDIRDCMKSIQEGVLRVEEKLK